MIRWEQIGSDVFEAYEGTAFLGMVMKNTTKAGYHAALIGGPRWERSSVEAAKDAIEQFLGVQGVTQ